MLETQAHGTRDWVLPAWDQRAAQECLSPEGPTQMEQPFVLVTLFEGPLRVGKSMVRPCASEEREEPNPEAVRTRQAPWLPAVFSS